MDKYTLYIEGSSHFRVGSAYIKQRSCIKDCLSPFGLLKHNATDWVAYTQQKFISHMSGGWQVHEQGVNRFGVWCEPAF